MSGTVPAPTQPAAAIPQPLPDYGPIIVACWAQAIFAATLVLAVLKILPDAALLLLIGAIIANAQQAASYYLGSSQGSKAKDSIIASSQLPPVPPPGGTVSTTTTTHAPDAKP